MTITDLEIDALVGRLNAFARDYDFDYGLPMYDNTKDEMRLIVKQWLSESVEEVKGGDAT